MIGFIKKIFSKSNDEAAAALVIQNLDNEHIGFNLFSPNIESEKGECVFIISPNSADLIETKEVSTLMNIKENGEHQWFRLNNEIIVSFNGEKILSYNENGILHHIPSESDLGLWFPAKKE